MRSFLQKITLLLLCTPVALVMAQVKFSASISSAQISKNEFVQLKLSVENATDVQQITPPAFKDFVVVSGPNQESGMTMINGDVKRYIALTYILKPKGTGNFSIAAGTAKADGKDYRSNPVSIQVSNTLASNNAGNNNNFTSPFGGMDPFADAAPETQFNDNVLKKGENAIEKVNKNMFIKLDLDKTSAYIGEPIVATYKLYTRLKSESNLVKNPSFNGFSVIDLQQPDNISSKRERVNGRDYNVYVLRKAQLYPLQSGTLELDPAQMDNNVSFIKEAYARQQSNANDVFGEFESATIPPEGIETHKVTLENKPATVTVKPLPDGNVPASFKGAVGNFTITAALEKDKFSTDDAGKLEVVISGSGNLQLINSPEIQWPQDFEAFDPATTDDLLKTSVPVSGRKIIDYPFTVTTPGTYTLPPIKFSFFDPKDGKYKTDSTKPISFTVTKGTGKSPKFKTVDPKSTEAESWLDKFIGNRRVIISTVAVLILCGLIFWLKRDKKKEEKETALKNLQIAEAKKIAEQEITDAIEIKEKNWLEKASVLLDGEGPAFYNELNFALKNYLCHKFKMPIETINKKNIIEALDKNNVAVDTSIQLQQVISEIELQLYTPFAEKEKMQELYSRAGETIELLDAYKC